MDVVRREIQKLRGSVEIQSAPGKGTTFLLKLPLTMAIIDGLVVTVGQERYIVPITAVQEMLRPKPDIVSTVRIAAKWCWSEMNCSRSFGCTRKWHGSEESSNL